MNSDNAALIYLGTCLTSLSLGYLLGFHTTTLPKSITTLPSASPEDDVEDVGPIPDGNLSVVSAGFIEPCKLVLLVRHDLKMSAADISTQCSQATLACYKALTKQNRKAGLVQHWERTGQAKIALKVMSEAQIMELMAVAKSLNLCARTISGTEGSLKNIITVLAIGPAPVELVNRVTGKLRLL